MAGLLRRAQPTLGLLIAVAVIGTGLLIGAWALAQPIVRFLEH
jgi:hypothetical protein